ncbi:MAG: pyrroline-5-carboxylate reductase family protein, partial [Bacilli bacterium]
MKKIGFIGVGNMGSALLSGIIKSEQVDPSLIYIYDHNKEQVLKVKNTYPCLNDTKSAMDIALECDYIFICLKPQQVSLLALDIKDYVKPQAIIISIAAGISLDKLQSYFNNHLALARLMPNTPALVLKGSSALCFNKGVSNDDQLFIISLCN